MRRMYQPRLARRWALALGMGFGLAPLSAATANGAGWLRHDEWEQYKADFLEPDGRIKDTGNGDRSHSEGQGFSMVMATAFDDPRTFLQLWQWTRTQLQVRDDSLLAWRWEPASGAVVDHNNATDGDLMVAWGLLRAYDLWGEPAWREAAKAILADVVASCIVERGNGRLLLPGAEGFAQEAGIVVNPSYWVFPAFRAFAAADIPGPWASLEETGVALINSFAKAGSGLVPDWCLIGDKVGPAEEFSFAFGFDAIRVPLYLSWAFPPEATRTALTPVSAYADRYPAMAEIPASVDLLTGEVAEFPLSLGAQATMLLADHRVIGGDLILPLQRTGADYYSSALLLLTKIAASEMPR